MSKFIFVSDLHLTDNPEDEYRWGVFPFLRGKIAGLGLGLKVLFILGDLCQNKDRHSATLVNRMVEEMVLLYRSGLSEIVILRGNHDGLGDVAYFDFLRWLPYIKVIRQPCIENFGLARIALLPHTRNPKDDWATIEFSEVNFILAHITVTGAKSESGFKLGGISADYFGKIPVYSGDVHVPQKIGGVEYIGAPYPIRFGDRFKGRMLCRDNSDTKEWHYPTIKKTKLVISDPSDLDKAWLRKGDQLKVNLLLPKEDRHNWKEHKDRIVNWCNKKGVKLHSVELHGQQVLRILRSKPQMTVSHTGVFKQYLNKSKTTLDQVRVGKGLFRAARNAHEN